MRERGRKRGMAYYIGSEVKTGQREELLEEQHRVYSAVHHCTCTVGTQVPEVRTGTCYTSTYNRAQI